MIERKFLRPDGVWARVENGELLYVPVITIRGSDHAHIYLSGQMARDETGRLVGIGDMRKQIRQICQNISKVLAHVGATCEDVVRTTTFVTDIEAYYRASDERFKYFKTNRPASTLLQISRLGDPEAMVEIECEAIIDTERLKG